MKKNGIKVFGLVVDNYTRCQHYASKSDIIAIKFACCKKYYPCYKCHEQVQQHKIALWSTNEFDSKAILCGACGNELTINQYLMANSCVHCYALFNPKCSLHYHLYFDMTKSASC
ncbi:CHY zinc finger protein [Radiobacillus sp. PE A8.2]|uniref:CHY zinc finger protein n=1 Tax=Radiobacillus sp. PE A8.2 TaxID=3380349 RepID=UPI00388F64A3